jgi:hypothetical protein
MTFVAATATLEAHLLTASGTAAVGFTIQGGDPGLPARKTACWYVAGSGDNPLIDETLTDHPFGDFVNVAFYWPVANRSSTPMRNLELEVRAVTRAFIRAVEGDRDLGGNCETVTIGDADAGWLVADGGSWRVVTIPLILGFTDEEPISR